MAAGSPADPADGAGRYDRPLIDTLGGIDPRVGAIATQIGVSQMHVSRLLAAALTRLRTGMLAQPPLYPDRPRGQS
jgi:hypothetical protein